MRQRLRTTFAGIAGLTLVGAMIAGPAGAAEPTSRAATAPTKTAPAKAATVKAPPVRKVVHRPIAFEVSNTNETSALCLADNRPYVLRGRLVGPRSTMSGSPGRLRVNVLVHDAGTGAWFWNLRQAPAFDYASQLARRGETSLVLDRLGYDRSPLANGHATCLGAQATMLHQVVQHLYSGNYRFIDRANEDDQPPHATHVVVHGHGTGATVAQLEAAEFADVAGLVLMSAPTATPTGQALRAVTDQLGRCVGGDGYSAYGATPAEFRSLLFASAPAKVRRLATARRNPTPCGDVSSLLTAVGSAVLGAGSVDVPVLVLSGGRDARVRRLDQAGAEKMFSSSARVWARTFAKAGSALPLEAGAAGVRETVLRFLAGVRPTL
ncbi:alpha/beta hydrolase [Nocardioides sp. IC4_145]|uniref:alpha/beta hydrolase n=1 Tax=Nocardioides sp. IC4_145 TaxID=2714037 RepID=UPI00140923BF|nr:alpha/beta hydrolase [Nocardioides sp. IC4_145]NHC22482.1 alpha/beta hydrolase [Nocardioides sp. IC4_145]